MNKKKSIEDLVTLLDKATKQKNKAAIDILSKAIFDFSEKQALEDAIESKAKIAVNLISGGSV